MVLKVVHPLKLYHSTQFYGLTLPDASFSSPQKFERASFWNVCSYGIRNYDIEVPNSVKMYDFVQKLMGRADRRTDRMVISLAYMFPIGRKVGSKSL
jgi:hypothetical protein